MSTEGKKEFVRRVVGQFRRRGLIHPDGGRIDMDLKQLKELVALCYDAGQDSVVAHPSAAGNDEDLLMKMFGNS